MKFSTAKTIVEKMVQGGHVVSLRSKRNGAVSEQTWDAIVGVLISCYDANEIGIQYAGKHDSHVFAKKGNGIVIFSCNVKLYSV